MSCNITKLKRCEIAGSTFNSPTFTIPIRDLTNDTFYAIVRNSFGSKIQTIAGIKSGQTITFPYSTLEPLKGRLTVEFWGVFAGLGTEMFAVEHFEICSNGLCGGEDSTIQNFDIVFKTVTIPISLTYSVVNLTTNQYLDFDDLTPEQKEALSFQYEDFTPEQILDLKQPAIDAAIVANAATDNANDKAILAEAAATNANDKATLANQKAGEAQIATTTANNAASNADAKAIEAQAATENANTATSNANAATINANNAASTANNAKGWSPLLVADTTTIAGKTLMKLSSWIGGTGTAPTTNVGQWQKADGTYTNVASTALDFKGTQGEVSNAQLTTALALKANKAQEGWITPTLINGWQNYDYYPPIQYYKDEFGIVHLKGYAIATTTSRTMFILPTTYRPAYRFESMPITSGGNAVNQSTARSVVIENSVYLFTAGGVSIITDVTVNLIVSLSGVTFKS